MSVGIRPLTEAQKQALEVLARGYSIKAGARLLGIEKDAFGTRVRSGRKNLGARSNEQAVAILVRNGMI